MSHQLSTDSKIINGKIKLQKKKEMIYSTNHSRDIIKIHMNIKENYVKTTKSKSYIWFYISNRYRNLKKSKYVLSIIKKYFLIFKY